MLTRSRSHSNFRGVYTLLQLLYDDGDANVHRKQFSASDFSRTLRDLGLTPSAVRRAHLYRCLRLTWLLFPLGLDSIVGNTLRDYSLYFDSLYSNLAMMYDIIPDPLGMYLQKSKMPYKKHRAVSIGKIVKERCTSALPSGPSAGQRNASVPG